MIGRHERESVGVGVMCFGQLLAPLRGRHPCEVSAAADEQRLACILSDIFVLSILELYDIVIF